MRPAKRNKRNAVITVSAFCFLITLITVWVTYRSEYRGGVLSYAAGFLNFASLITLLIAVLDVKRRALSVSLISTVALTIAALIMAFKGYDGEWFTVVCAADAFSIITLIFGLHKRTLAKGGVKGRGAGGVFGKLASLFKKKKNKYKNGKLYLRGKSKTEFVFGSRGRGRKSAKKIRANPSKGKTNNEKIRLMYIKRILEMISSGKRVLPSTTPAEASRLRDRGEDGALYSAYEKLRYSGGFSASDEETLACLGTYHEK
ncbi:MAG: hypothetical protein IJT70_03510 [Clostridia bacterium]|nr:hypothetical protein [Clostridia bacterium]